VNFHLPAVCLTDPYASFKDSSFIADHTEGSFVFLWNFDDSASGTENVSLLENPKHTFHSTGYYNIQLSIQSQQGCMNDTTKIFTVNGAIPKASFMLLNPSPLCSYDTLILKNNSSVDFGSIVKTEIYWDNIFNPSSKETDKSPYPGKTYSFNYGTLDHSFRDYQIRMVSYSGINCISDTIETVRINRSPSIAFNALSPVCEDKPSFLISQAQELTGETGSGIYSGPAISPQGFFEPHSGVGDHLIKYTFTADNGCIDSAIQKIVVLKQPEVDAGPNKTIVKGVSTTLHAVTLGNIQSYSWTPFQFINDPSVSDPMVSPPNDMMYHILVRTIDGCMNQDSIYIHVVDQLYIPNAFSPNNDGLNDVWHIPNLDSYPNAEVWIYNRWGEIVYHSAGPNTSWNGQLNGKDLPVGNYIYVVDLKGNTPVLKGTISLIR
jgi:gliding motility-associated-like protein